MHDEQTPVLIVGGSLVGLSTSLFLTWHGVPSLLVERHPSTSIHPRAGSYNPRTMELFRTVGLEQSIREAANQVIHHSGILRVETLAGKQLDWFDAPYLQRCGADLADVTVTGWGLCWQDKLEPILRARIEHLGGDLRFSTVLVSFEQDDDGVTAVVKDRTTGVERTIRARYLVAADGHNSSVRRRLAVPTHGVGTMVHLISILFCADLRGALRGRHFAVCHVNNPEVKGSLSTAGDGDRMVLGVAYHPEHGETPEQFTEARCAALVRAAVGVPDLPVQIVSVLPWELAAWVAERFCQGRVLLAGDAVHVHPPTGAFGANTGIQDAHNLAWKLAYVIKGLAGPDLLATYDAERRPVGAFTVDQVVARALDRYGRPEAVDAPVAAIVDDLIVMMGYRYDSAAVLSEDGDQAPEDPRRPTGRPGTRAPHVLLERNGERRSTLDLFGRHFVLLASAGPWHDAAQRVAGRRGLGLETHSIGGGDGFADVDGRWPDAYGVTPAGAVLVRPDGFVAWRAHAGVEDPERILDDVRSRVCCLPRCVAGQVPAVQTERW